MNPPDSEAVPPLDAWAFAAMLGGRTLNGELERVSDPNRRVALRLNAADPEGRRALFDGFLGLMDEPEAAAFLQAVGAADPLRPPPEAEPWPALRLGEIPAVPPFPVEALPPPVARVVADVSSAIGCSPDFAAVHALGIAAGAIGRSRSLCFGANRFFRSSLYVAAVGLAGDGKSPALAYLDSVIRDIEQGLADAFRDAKDLFERESEGRKKGDPRPRPPAPTRLGLNDATIEALYRILADNPRGILLHLDELSTFLLGLNQYKSGGNDRSQVLRIWTGASVSIDRVLNEFREPIRIPHPAVTIHGNIPPSVLPRMFVDGIDDGFLDRWLFAAPNVLPKLRSFEKRPVSNATLEEWGAIVRRLWALEMEQRDGKPHPKVVYFTNDGFAEFNRLGDEMVDEVNAPDFPKALRGPWAKLEEYAGRLCLILTALGRACDPTAPQEEELPRAGVDEARAAWALIGYFKDHFRRVRAYLLGKGLGGAPEGTDLILKWIKAHKEVESFSEREIKRNFSKLRDDHAALEDALAYLAERKAIRLKARPKEKDKRGRNPSPSWEIHPSLRAPQNCQKCHNSGVAPPDGPGGLISGISGISAAHGWGEGEEGGDDARPAS